MKYVVLLPVLLLSFYCNAQDAFFTQYANSPLVMNPANTGLINGQWRAAANYRNEWNSVTVPFVTTSLSYDMSLGKKMLNGSSLGLGVLGYYRTSGDGHNQNLNAGISLAYHQKIGKSTQRKHTLSIGLQALVVQKELSFSTINRLDIYQLDAYLDYNGGIMYTGFIGTRGTIYAGLSYYHFTRPVEMYFGDPYKIQSRMAWNLGGSYAINKGLRFLGSAAYQQQGKAYDVQLGGAAGIAFNPEQNNLYKRKELMLGSIYRFNNGISPYVSMQWNKATLGLSYDMNLSDVQTATKPQGSFELSLIYNGHFTPDETHLFNSAYPRF